MLFILLAHHIYYYGTILLAYIILYIILYCLKLSKLSISILAEVRAKNLFLWKLSYKLIIYEIYLRYVYEKNYRLIDSRIINYRYMIDFIYEINYDYL